MSSKLQQIVDHWESQLGDAQVRWALGRRELQRHVDAPRVVVVPVGGPIEPAREVGRRDISSAASRTLYQRSVAVEVYVWGRDQEETEQLYESVIVALRRSDAMGSVRLGDEAHIAETPEQAGDVNRGDAIMFTVTFEIPIADQIKTTKVVADIGHVGKWVPATAPIYGWFGLDYNDPGIVYGGGTEAVC